MYIKVFVITPKIHAKQQRYKIMEHVNLIIIRM
jgi:hypothetical protein